MAFLIDNSTQTIPIAVSSLTGDRLMDVTTTAAASLISIVPTLIFYLIFQRTLSRGITAGAVKVVEWHVNAPVIPVLFFPRSLYIESSIFTNVVSQYP